MIMNMNFHFFINMHIYLCVLCLKTYIVRANMTKKIFGKAHINVSFYFW